MKLIFIYKIVLGVNFSRVSLRCVSHLASASRSASCSFRCAFIFRTLLELVIFCISFAAMKQIRDLQLELTRNNIKSSISPSAQNNIQCAADDGRFADMVAKLTRFYADKNLSIELKALVEILELSGCRVSQILQVHYKNISTHGQIKIIGSKNGNDIIVKPQMYKEFWLDYRRNGISFRSVYSRFALYRLFKHYGLFIKVESSQKKSVCHCFRHMLATDTATITTDKTIIANKLGHKSTNTQKYYVHKE